MKLKYIGPSQPLSLINGNTYDCIDIEGDMVRIIDEEELENNSQEELEKIIYNKSTESGYLYSVLTPIPSGLTECGVWEIIEDSNENDLLNTLNKYIKEYDKQEIKFNEIKEKIKFKYSK